MYKVNESIGKWYDFNVERLSKVREVYIVHTNKGLRCLKKIDKPKDQIMFMHEIKEYLVKNGFANVDRFELTRYGLPYIEIEEEYYAITCWIAGRESELLNSQDLKKATRALAVMHKAMNGFRGNSQFKSAKSVLGKWPEEFNKKTSELIRLNKEAKKGKTKFDDHYRENSGDFIALAKVAMTTLENSPYMELVRAPSFINTFCHRDYTYHNIIIGEEGSCYIIDFDYCCFELSIYDIAGFVMRSMRKNSWNVDAAKEILEDYDKINHISMEEYETMKSLFIYPQKFWRIANRYYNKRHKHMDLSLYNKLCEEIEQKELKEDFLRKMKFI